MKKPKLYSDIKNKWDSLVCFILKVIKKQKNSNQNVEQSTEFIVNKKPKVAENDRARHLREQWLKDKKARLETEEEKTSVLELFKRKLSANEIEYHNMLNLLFCYFDGTNYIIKITIKIEDKNSSAESKISSLVKNKLVLEKILLKYLEQNQNYKEGFTKDANGMWHLQINLNDLLLLKNELIARLKSKQKNNLM